MFHSLPLAVKFVLFSLSLIISKTSFTVFLTKKTSPNLRIDPSLEFLRSFDVSNGQGASTLTSEETEELSFSVICRTREITGEDDSKNDEERPPEREQLAEEEVSPCILSSRESEEGWQEGRPRTHRTPKPSLTSRTSSNTKKQYAQHKPTFPLHFDSTANYHH